MQNEQNFFQILVSIYEILNKHTVRNMIVGGAAVGIHGHYRPTTDREGNETEKPDLDVWFHPLYLNYQKLLNAFDDMGFDTSRFRERHMLFPKVPFSNSNQKTIHSTFCLVLAMVSTFGTVTSDGPFQRLKV